MLNEAVELINSYIKESKSIQASCIISHTELNNALGVIFPVASINTLIIAVAYMKRFEIHNDTGIRTYKLKIH